MLQMTIATLREGIEAFLIVALAAAYLRQTARVALLPALWTGACVAVVLSIAIGVFLADIVVTPLWEGVLALVAAALVVSMAVYMRRVAPRLGASIGAGLEQAAARPGAWAWIGVFAFALVMVTREGMEMAFITAALARNEDGAPLVAGALLGAALAALLAWAWQRWGRRVNLKLFFEATSIFLVLFACQLLLYAFHEFTEGGLLPLDNAFWHIATEDWVEGTYGQWLTALLVLAPVGWVLWSLGRSRTAAHAA
jgi:high-affinity iron transporter